MQPVVLETLPWPYDWTSSHLSLISLMNNHRSRLSKMKRTNSSLSRVQILVQLIRKLIMKILQVESISILLSLTTRAWNLSSEWITKKRRKRNLKENYGKRNWRLWGRSINIFEVCLGTLRKKTQLKRISESRNLEERLVWKDGSARRPLSTKSLCSTWRKRIFRPRTWIAISRIMTHSAGNNLPPPTSTGLSTLLSPNTSTPFPSSSASLR